MSLRLAAALVALALTPMAWAQSPAASDSTVASPPPASAADSTAVPALVAAPASVDSSRTPGGAVRRALLLPGLGQVYNRQPIKTPFVVAALGGAVTYFVIQQRRTTLYRRAALYAGCQESPDREVCVETDLDALLPAFEETGSRAAATLRTIRDDARGSRDLAAVGIAAVYTLQVLDAYVGAELLHFDVSEDLSLRATPASDGATLALRVRL